MTTIDIDCTLAFSLSRWPIPDSHHNISIIEISGDAPKESIQKNSFKFREIILRLFSDYSNSKVLLVDVSKMNSLDSDVYLSLLSIVQEIDHYRFYYRFICREDQCFFPEEVRVDVSISESLDIAYFDNKHLRNDKGKKILEVCKQDLHRIQNVLLYQSKISIHFEIIQRNNLVFGVFDLKGDYPKGSAGTEDGKSILIRLENYLHFYPVHGCLINLQDLNYDWGDDLSLYPADYTVGGKKNLLFVLSPNQQEAFLYAIGREEEDLQRILYSKEEALDKLFLSPDV